MKKLIFIVIAVFAMIKFVSAQEYGADFRDRLQFGLKVGMNYSNVYDANGEGFSAKAKAGLATGLFITIPIGTYLGVQPEILLSQKDLRQRAASLAALMTLNVLLLILMCPCYLL